VNDLLAALVLEGDEGTDSRLLNPKAVARGAEPCRRCGSDTLIADDRDDVGVSGVVDDDCCVVGTAGAADNLLENSPLPDDMATRPKSSSIDWQVSGC
jgi:hypothetical protein